MESQNVSEPSSSARQETQSAEATDVQHETASLQKIVELLKAKDDTSKFVGLALLKSALDNSPKLRQDENTVLQLWNSISPKFLNRLIRTGSGANAAQKDAKDMLELAIAVIHTFTALLPDEGKREEKLIKRIPLLVGSIPHISRHSIQLTIQILLTLVSFQEGAKVFLETDDTKPLIAIAPHHRECLDIFSFAWLNLMPDREIHPSLQRKINEDIRDLVSAFKGTDAVTLLEFIGHVFRNADPVVLPQTPKWLKDVVKFIQNLVASRPTPEGRSAYTNVAAAMLQTYPVQAPRLLFSEDSKADKPFSYLFVNLLLIDLRSSFPTLLEQINKAEYVESSRRLASAFDVISSFTGFLVQSIDGDDRLDSMAIPPPDLLLKLRKSISETMSATIEYLRDRWDASVAGAMGLHPDARLGAAETSMGSRLTLAWDSMKDSVNEDPLLLAAIRSLAIWLREDDNDSLRKETSGLSDMFMDLYQHSSASRLDFRSPILVALEGMTALEEGVQTFLSEKGWDTLTKDLISIHQYTSKVNDENAASRGIEVVRILLPIVEAENTGSREDWMGLVTAVAAWDCPDAEQSPLVQEFQVAVLQLVTALLVNAHEGIRRRYVHSTSAVLGIANQLRPHIKRTDPLMESIQDVLITLGSLR